MLQRLAEMTQFCRAMTGNIRLFHSLKSMDHTHVTQSPNCPIQDPSRTSYHAREHVAGLGLLVGGSIRSFRSLTRAEFDPSSGSAILGPGREPLLEPLWVLFLASHASLGRLILNVAETHETAHLESGMRYQFPASYWALVGHERADDLDASGDQTLH